MNEELAKRQIKRFDLKEPRPEVVIPDLSVEVEDMKEGFRKAAEGVVQAFNGFSEAVRKLAQSITPIFKDTVEYLNRCGEWWRIQQKAIDLGLVSDRVFELTCHRKARVGKKNCNRVRKEVRLYEKRQTQPGQGRRWADARKKRERDGRGDGVSKTCPS